MALDRSQLRRALTFWRRSIQARVVLSTLLLSAATVGIVGWVLLAQTRDGLIRARVDAALSESVTETREARTRLTFVGGTDSDVAAQQQELVTPMIQRGTARGFAVVLSPPLGRSGRLAAGGAKFTPGLDLVSVPTTLQDRFSRPAATAWMHTRIRTTADTAVQNGPGIVVASQVTLPADGETYTLYFVFGMTEESDTLDLVTRAMLTAGALLLVLVAAVTFLVTRQVVSPVRMARQVAEKLADGDLEQRLVVRGEDDLARLATSFNQMAAGLQRQIGQLEELSRLQQRFVSDVSHELRTPLTTVRMAGDMLHDARVDFDPATKRAAELLQTELDRFERLLADLLEISRFDAGAAVLEAEDINLVDVVMRVGDLWLPMAEKQGTRILVRAPSGSCVVQADVRRVERIVRNLVANALDHAEATDVEIEVASGPSACAITVRDHGVGMSTEQVALVFNRFWRADPARARTSGGTGLGLSISLEDARLHGGWLQAWGRPGAGAVFRLTLPKKVGAEVTSSPLPLIPPEEDA